MHTAGCYLIAYCASLHLIMHFFTILIDLTGLEKYGKREWAVLILLYTHRTNDYLSELLKYFVKTATIPLSPSKHLYGAEISETMRNFECPSLRVSVFYFPLNHSSSNSLLAYPWTIRQLWVVCLTTAACFFDERIVCSCAPKNLRPCPHICRFFFFSKGIFSPSLYPVYRKKRVFNKLSLSAWNKYKCSDTHTRPGGNKQDARYQRQLLRRCLVSLFFFRRCGST